MFTTEAEEELLAKKAKKRTSASDAEKRAKLPDEIFNYIHTAKCRRLFSLDWYDDTSYAPSKDGYIQPLPNPCCNGFSCKSPDPEYLNQVPFTDTTAVKYKESEREWIAVRTAELKKWRTAKSKAYWADQEVENMPDSLLMPDACLLALAKHSGLLLNEAQIDQFLQPWYGVNEYSNEILAACIRQSSSHGDTPPTKTERKEALRAARVSKKAKGMDDPIIAKVTRITDLRDQWLIKRKKITPNLKAKMKKMKAAEDKEKAKTKAKQDKKRETSQIHSMRRLALGNSQIGSFKDVLSDPPIAGTDLPSSNPIQLPTPIRPTMAIEQSVDLMRSANDQTISKKRAAALKRVNTMEKNRQKRIAEANKATSSTTVPRSQTPRPVQIELIRPGSKRRVRVTSNAIENTPSKCMKAVEQE